MTKLFRIEHKTFKNGPYRIIETDIPIDTLNRCKLKRVSENVALIPNKYTTGPFDEFRRVVDKYSNIDQNSTAYRNAFEEFIDFVENKDTRFCFKSISQLLKWFNRKNENDINVLKLLRKNGYEIVEYEISSNTKVIHLAKQSLFHNDNTVKVTNNINIKSVNRKLYKSKSKGTKMNKKHYINLKKAIMVLQ